MTSFWEIASQKMRDIASANNDFLNQGQKLSLLAIAERLPHNGVIVADEVGMGKTRIAVAVTKAVLEAQGRVAIVIPVGLGYQWQAELRKGGIISQPVLRNIWQYVEAWQEFEPWFRQRVVLISHRFFNWRITDSKNSKWKWFLLAALYALNRKDTRGYSPRDYYKEREELISSGIIHVATSIMEFIKKNTTTQTLKNKFFEIINDVSWNDSTDTGVLSHKNYQKYHKLREPLEAAIGLGLGAFDLVIIDEAHKNRNESSNLSSLLKALPQMAHGRRLGLTATPIELNIAQWTQILDRIQAENAVDESIISEYLDVVDKIRKYPEDPSIQQKFVCLSKRFEQAFKPFLLRRDKRAEKSINKFKLLAESDSQDYRLLKPIHINAADLETGWKKAVCAAEALSFINTGDSVAQRLRLTIANGHGLSAILDSQNASEGDLLDEVQAQPCEPVERDFYTDSSNDVHYEMRAKWWQRVLRTALPLGEHALYNHPEIILTASEIEKVCARGEKILVFGKFVAPLRALTELLNAREMLRRLNNTLFWPQSVISKWDVVEAAWKQIMPSARPLDKADVQKRLADQYRKLQAKRADSRKKLMEKLSGGFKDYPRNKYTKLYEEFKKEVFRNEKNSDDSALGLVDRALRDIIGDNYGSGSASEIRDNFISLMHAMTDQESDDDFHEINDDFDNHRSSNVSWQTVKERLHNEFSSREGQYARLMYGKTAHETRRYMQLAFNREKSALKILIAQSMVGREGLNLHESCRTVVLLHPEWNPGVVEQQIGRIDRLGSLWEKMLNDLPKNASPADLPHIEIRPVIFYGTYDERNWSILKARWDDLRAQLHGIIIPPASASNNLHAQLIEQINNNAPRFSPSD